MSEELTSCPCCVRGTIVNAQCTRCGVMIPAGVDAEQRTHPGRRPRYREDQDRVNKYTDYARTKADK